MTNGMGSTDAIHVLLPGKFTPEFSNASYFPEIPYLKNGQFYTFACTMTSGSMLKWYKNTFGESARGHLRTKGAGFYETMEYLMGDKPSGLVTVPSFSNKNLSVTFPGGTVYGLTLSTTGVQIYRSLLEGVAYSNLFDLEILKTQGAGNGDLHGTGGGSLSPVWMQIKADILDKRVINMGKDACARGGMMLSAVAVGEYATIDDAVKKLVKPGKVYEPDKYNREVYMKSYEIYIKLHKRLNEEGVVKSAG